MYYYIKSHPESFKTTPGDFLYNYEQRHFYVCLAALINVLRSIHRQWESQHH